MNVGRATWGIWIPSTAKLEDPFPPQPIHLLTFDKITPRDIGLRRGGEHHALRSGPVMEHVQTHSSLGLLDRLLRDGVVMRV